MVGTRRLGPRRHARDATPFGCASSARAKVRTIGRLSGIVATARLSVFSATSTSGSRSPKNRMRAGGNWPCQQFACADRWRRVARRARETLGDVWTTTRGERPDHEIHEERGERLDHETHEMARKARKPPFPHPPRVPVEYHAPELDVQTTPWSGGFRRALRYTRHALQR